MISVVGLEGFYGDEEGPTCAKWVLSHRPRSTSSKTHVRGIPKA